MRHFDSLPKRFFDRIIKGRRGCLLYRRLDGQPYQYRYGQLIINGSTVLAHRYAFFLRHGYYPEIVHHTCEQPACVNPDHLVEFTIGDHIREHRKIRQST